MIHACLDACVDHSSFLSNPSNSFKHPTMAKPKTKKSKTATTPTKSTQKKCLECKKPEKTCACNKCEWCEQKHDACTCLCDRCDRNVFDECMCGMKCVYCMSETCYCDAEYQEAMNKCADCGFNYSYCICTIGCITCGMDASIGCKCTESHE